MTKEAKTNLVTSAKVTVQASLLTVAYSIGYGIGATSKTFNRLVGEKNLGFVKEMMTEAGRGYTAAVEKEDTADARLGSATA